MDLIVIINFSEKSRYAKILYYEDVTNSPTILKSLLLRNAKPIFCNQPKITVLMSSLNESCNVLWILKSQLNVVLTTLND